jgi:hypothetical protein
LLMLSLSRLTCKHLHEIIGYIKRHMTGCRGTHLVIPTAQEAEVGG